MPFEIERLTAAQAEARRVAAAARHAAALLAGDGSLPARIRMLETHSGSPDGHNLHTYTAGEVYDAHTTPRMSAHLADIFLRAGWAEDADTPLLAAPVTAPEPTPEPTPEPASAPTETPEPPTRRAQRRPGPTERKTAQGADREPAE